ncbi:MAG: hypothetical protein HKP50_00105 [Myxococcales bacterium]|nr:hypothetical protein [Myxococcales bacterium]
MLRTRSMRWLVLVVCGALAALGCSTDTQPGDTTGSLSLDLVLGDGVVINSVSWTISGGDMEPMSGVIDTSAPGSTASVEVYGLPPGDGYVVELQATSEDGEVTCQGSTDFAVTVGVATDLMVVLNCKLPVDTGAVRVNGKLNICAQLFKVVVSPLQTSVGNAIDLSATGEDHEGDPIHYAWTGTGGSIADPGAASTTYTCDQAGEQTVTITISDDDFEYCMDDWTVPVTCVELALCDDVDCDDGNECTDDECDLTSGECINAPVQDGTACDEGTGMCSAGQCVEIDLCMDVDCDDGNECTVDACDPSSGECSNEPVQDGTSCDEGAGTCSIGQCIVVNLCEGVDCTSDNECVEDGSCDPETGLCIAGANEPDGTACGDGGFCDGNGNCIKINNCAELNKVVVAPLQTSTGNQISLSALGTDEDEDPIEYLWTGTGGSIEDSSAASTTYTCNDLGEQSVTVAVSDDGFDGCIDELTVPVTCVDDD